MYVFFKEKTANDMRISDWSSNVFSSDLILAVVVPAVVAAEVEDVLLEQPARVVHALRHALLEQREDRERRVEFAGLDRAAHVVLELREPGDVRRDEEHLAAVERIEVALEDVGRQGAVQRPRPIGIAAVRQQAVDQLRGGDRKSTRLNSSH